MRRFILIVSSLAVAAVGCDDDGGGPELDGAGPSPAQRQGPEPPSSPGPDAGGDSGAFDSPGPDAAPPAPEVEPLRLAVTEPVRGARLFGPTVRVSGRLTGGEAPELIVAGVPVTPEADGAFSVELAVEPGLNVIVTEARDGPRRAEDRRAVLQDADVDPAGPVERATVAHVGPSGFDAIAALLTDYLAGLDLAALVAGNLPDRVEVEELRYDEMRVGLSPRDGHLRVELTVENLYVALRGTVDLGWDITFRGNASADPAVIVARVRMSAAPDGGLEMEILDATVELRNFDYDIRGVPGFAENWFAGMARDFAQDLIADALSSYVLPSLFDPAALDRSFEIMGRTLDVSLRVRNIDLRRRGMEMELAARVTAGEIVREGDAVRPLGGRPEMGGPRDLDLAAGADLVARLLHAAWAGGLLDFRLDAESGIETPVPLTIGLLRPALGEAAAGLDPSTPLVITTRPLLPAVAWVEDGERPLVIAAGDLLLDLSTPDELLATVAVDLVARASVQIDGLGDLAIQPDFEIEAHADVAETPRGPVNESRLEEQVEAFAALIPPLVADRTFTFGADVLPVPIRLRDVEVSADDVAPFIHVRADLEQP